MKKIQRIVSLVICFALLLSLCACADGTKTANVKQTDDENVHVNLKWFLRTSEPEGFDEVMELANEYLNEKLNVTLDIQCIEPGDYDSKVQLALASGEAFDIVWTSNWANKYEPNIAKGAFLALDEYLELPELAELKEYYREGIWEAARVNGKIYGVPMEQIFHSQAGFSFMKDIAEKYNLTDRIRDMAWVDENTHGSMEEMEEIFDIVREGEPKDYAITTGGVIDTFGPSYTQIANYWIVDDKIVDLYEHDERKALRARSWNEKGYFPADIATLDNADAYKKEGKVFSNYDRYLPGVEGKFRISNSYDVIIIPTSEAVINRGGIQSTLNAISITSENPIRALKLINLLNHDEYLLNLLCYGIEGRDYTKDPENPKRMNRESGAYYIAEFMVGSQFLAYLVPSYEDGVWEETKRQNEESTIDPYIGFSFETTAVESEIAQVSAVKTEYNKILSYGLSDPEIMLSEREEKYKLAGKQIIMDEIQRQLNEWLANK